MFKTTWVQGYKFLLKIVRKHFLKNVLSEMTKVFSLTDKWLTRKSKQLMVDRDRLQNDKNYVNFFDLKNNIGCLMTTIATGFIEILMRQQKLTEKKWMMINELRDTDKKPRFFSLRNVFGDYKTQTKKLLTC